jgi:hypothetical protein
MARNNHVEICADLLIDLIDDYLNGKKLESPPSGAFRDFLDVLMSHGGSVRLATVFLFCYSVVDRSWDGYSVPTGIRGKYGDKKIASSLNETGECWTFPNSQIRVDTNFSLGRQ